MSELPPISHGLEGKTFPLKSRADLVAEIQRLKEQLDEAVGLVEAADRERDEALLTRDIAATRAEHLRKREAKLREAIERHRDAFGGQWIATDGLEVAEGESHQELWAILNESD